MRRRTHITSFTVTCATPGCARAQSVPGWRIKPSLRIKASTEGYLFVCLFLFFPLKILLDIIVKMAWNCRRICEEVLRSKTTTTLSAQSYPEKGSFENEMWSLHKPSPRLWKKKFTDSLVTQFRLLSFILPVFQKVWLLDVLQGTKSSCKHPVLNWMEQQRTNEMLETAQK